MASPQKLFGVADETQQQGGMFGVPDEAPPGAPQRPPLPEALKPDAEQSNSFVTSPHGFIRSGLSRAVHGFESMAEPGADAKFGGASEIIRGLGTAAIPAAIPLAVANPMTAIAGAAVGAPVQAGAEWGASKLGASPGASHLAGDVAGGVAGFGTGALVNRVGSVLKSALPARETQDALMELVPYFGKKVSALRNIADPPYAPMERSAPKDLPNMPKYGGPSAAGSSGGGARSGGVLRRVAVGDGSEGMTSGTRTIQHLGDMRLPRNQPKAPPPSKLYDASGRLLR